MNEEDLDKSIERNTKELNEEELIKSQRYYMVERLNVNKI